ncbi:MAG: ATP-binding cassette domain-containing protein [Spirochaetes bacterium]|jgi:ATP-binding cassette subfamily F protein uup|nr:ATP-binding cassette domain-containing protein [Spirochaetota bacterium]
MALITLQNINHTFGSEPLFNSITVHIEIGEKIALLGRNGSGKSTFMKTLHRSFQPDSGEVITSKYFRSALLPQDVPSTIKGSIASVVQSGLSRPDDTARVEFVLSLLTLDGSLLFETLSAGMKRRVLLGRALADDPDILLLDEPTNHLDIDSITWLENFLIKYTGTILLITHDREFMRNIANRIIEIDRGRLFDWKCDYTTFIDRKSEWLENEETQNRLFDKKLSEEEAWIRKGIKARRTRNEGRVRALLKMREAHSARRTSMGSARLEANQTCQSGKMIVEADSITFGFDTPLISDFSIRIVRGDKIGIIGPNGCGKSTLIQILLGLIPVQHGSVRTGANLQIAYFDQLRNQCDDALSIIENVSGGCETVHVNGRDRHIISYLQDFLFTPERLQEKSAVLSGGEKNRLLLAKLFTQPANVLILDEPTNDLDIETVELLEELISDFDGTVLTVSHDRSFLNNIATDIINFEEDGTILTYAGGYDDYLIQSGKNSSQKRSELKEKSTKIKPKSKNPKLSYKEKQELDNLPQMIEELESKIDFVHAELADPELYKNKGDEVTQKSELAEQLESEMETLFSRWEELEAKRIASEEATP